jgi:hypothetical protein
MNFVCNVMGKKNSVLMSACRRLPQHAVQPEPAGLRGRREVLILVDVRGEQLQRDGGRRRDHVGRRGRRVRQEDPTQTVASICTCAELHRRTRMDALVYGT